MANNNAPIACAGSRAPSTGSGKTLCPHKPTAWRTFHEPAVVYLLAGLALHLLWAWWFERYLLPYLPFLLWGLWVAVERVKKGLGVWVLAVMVLMPLPTQTRGLMRARESRHKPEYAAAYQWIQRNTRPHEP